MDFLQNLLGLGQQYESQVNYDPYQIKHLSQINQNRMQQGQDPMATDYYLNTYLPVSMRPNELNAQLSSGMNPSSQGIGRGALTKPEADFLTYNPYAQQAYFGSMGAPGADNYMGVGGGLQPLQDNYLSGLYRRYANNQ